MTTATGHGRVRLLVAVAGLVAVVVVAGVGVATTTGRGVVASWMVKVPEGSSATPTTGAGSASATAGLPTSYTVPGTLPQLPWPAAGQASVEVSGAGSLGATPANIRCRSPVSPR
jgi:hypothetical protein